MAIGTATAIAGGIGLLGSGFQAIKGAEQSAAARRELENYQRQQLENAYENVQVSTLGADLQREEQARLAASQTEALRGAGVRGLVGGLGRVEAGSQMMNAQIGADLDRQQQAINQAIAQDEAQIRAMQEQREMQDISALSSQYNAGQQTMMSGLGGIAQTGLGLATSGIFDKKNVDTPPIPPANTQTNQQNLYEHSGKSFEDILAHYRGIKNPTPEELASLRLFERTNSIIGRNN
jgi:hypothetical protein